LDWGKWRKNPPVSSKVEKFPEKFVVLVENHPITKWDPPIAPVKTGGKQRAVVGFIMF
jgi:hypothetical protein